MHQILSYPAENGQRCEVISMDTPSVTDWVQAISAGVTAVTSVFLLAAIYLTREQIRLAKEELKSVDRWNRITATFTFFTTNTLAEPESKAAAALRSVHMDLQRQTTPLTDAQVEKLIGDFDAFAQVRIYLNTLEDYAVAVTCGALDEETAYRMMSHVVARHFRIFKPLLDRRRADLNDSTVYCEIQRLAGSWARGNDSAVPSSAA